MITYKRVGGLRFLRVGRPSIPVRTSAAEQFASGDDGGVRWASIASLVETCELNGIDPQGYFTDMLTRLVNGCPNSRIDELMPWCRAKADD
jgi:hypothetical protein